MKPCVSTYLDHAMLYVLILPDYHVGIDPPFRGIYRMLSLFLQILV